MEDSTEFETPSRPATTTAASVKPVKLRSACNQCFYAKVKCDANKSGCARCAEKHLPCVFSESRVGKVVGKRRKRPLDEWVELADSEAWIVNNYLADPSMPSPATTNSSDEHTKRSCTNPSWTSFITDDHAPSTWDTMDEHYPNISEMDQAACFSLTNEQKTGSRSGLPTPALSPSQTRYMSPRTIDTRPTSRRSSIVTNANMFRPPGAASTQRNYQSQVSEDEEMICIKLLAHVKKQSQVPQTLESAIGLLRKVNAALKRIMGSKVARSDYSCQMHLTSILSLLVGLCERSSKMVLEAKASQQAFAFQQNPQFYEASFTMQRLDSPEAVLLRDLIQTVSNISSTLADSLKRKPLNGFQTLGRHESLMLTLGQRLKMTLASLKR